MLHTVPQRSGPHLYCGPTAICAITGVDRVDVLAAAHRYMARPFSKPIVGMYDEQLIGALAILGFRVRYDTWLNKRGEYPTLRQYATSIEPDDPPRIVRIADHFCAVSYDEYLCNQTGGLPVPLLLAPKMRARVHSTFEVHPL